MNVGPTLQNKIEAHYFLQATEIARTLEIVVEEAMDLGLKKVNGRPVIQIAGKAIQKRAEAEVYAGLALTDGNDLPAELILEK